MSPSLRPLVLVALLAATPLAVAAQAPLGLSVSSRPSGLPSAVIRAATVTRVHPDSAAAQAGLQAGDEIVAIDGRPLSAGGARPMPTRLREAATRPLQLAIRRDGALHDVTLAPRRVADAR